MSESDLAQRVVKALGEQGWTIYQEVEGTSGRADIVAVQGTLQWVIECKLSFGFSVLDQAIKWRGRCHYVSVATPSSSRSSLGEIICRDYGIGHLIVAPMSDEVRELIKPCFYRRAKPLKLYPEQQSYCQAGSSGGGHWTLFKRTKENLIQTVRRNPGIEFNKLIKELNHHYGSFSTAKSCLRKWVGTSVLPEIRVEKVGKKLCAFIKEA